ncbi:MAG: hypothetical protein WBB17_06130 [Saprospiraceae bacterium]|jgi:hypothetical protein|nr:hypothetical protein [Saprospiraceae bacterium]MBK9993913.1 hypothetical protein [Saprospiraceae bacterium]
MSYWIKFFLLFFAGCFFLLPALNVEDPFRSLSLRFFSKEAEAEIYNHSCKPDRIYLYQYNINGKNYKQRYDGYVESIDQLIPEQERCKEAVASLPKMQIRYFPLFSFWSEPIMSERPNLLMFFGINLVKIFSLLILLWTFLRK